MSLQPTSMESEGTTTRRQALEQQLEALREKNRLLRSQLDQQQTKNKELHATLVESNNIVETEEEHISNSLLKRLESLRREKDQLNSQLIVEEKRKSDKETLLYRLKKNRSALEKHLRQEEVEIRDRLQRQLHKTQTQRLELQFKVEAESATLHQLHECIRSLRDNQHHVSPAMSPSRPSQPPPPALAAFGVPGSCSSPSAAPSDSEALSFSRSEVTHSAKVVPPLNRHAIGNLRGGGGHGNSVGDVADSLSSVCRSPSATSLVQDVTTPLGTSTCQSDGTPVSSRRSVADNGMLRLLESEIHVAEALRRDAERRATDYAQRIEGLQTQITEAERERNQQRQSADVMRAELARTTHQVSEMNAAQEVAAEWCVDRELLGGHVVRSSSLCSTVSSHTTVTATADTPLGAHVTEFPEGFGGPKVLHNTKLAPSNA